MSTIKDTDLLLVSRGGVDYKITALELKEQLNHKSLPWEGHDGGIWHVKNASQTLKLYDRSAPYQAYTVDGVDLGEIYEFGPGDDLIFLTSYRASKLFTSYYNANSTNITWDFGEHTDTSKVTLMDGLFHGNEEFNSDISGWDTSSVTNMMWMFKIASDFNQDISSWDTSSVTNMDSMFEDASDFNQDLSDWCVTQIPTTPDEFDVGATSWTLPRPVWGTCPRGEDK